MHPLSQSSCPSLSPFIPESVSGVFVLRSWEDVERGAR